MSADTAEGEFRVPQDPKTEQLAETTTVLADGDDDEAAEQRGRRRRRRRGRGDLQETVPDPADVDTSRTPGTTVAALALGVVAPPLLGVYAVLFITRYFLQPGVSPDITSSWSGEGIAGVAAAVLAIAMFVIVARAAGGRGLGVFIGAQVVVVATCGYLLSDSSSGGRSVTIVVGVLALASIGCATEPVSRRWFAAHTAERSAEWTLAD